MEFGYDVVIVVWYLGACSFILWIVEFFGMHVFQKLFYKLGFIAFHQSYDLGSYKIQDMPKDILKMDEGKFKFINPNECLFTSKLHLFKFFRFQTPISFKGTAVWNNKNVEFYGRLPICPTLFMLFWLIFWTTASLGTEDIMSCLFGLMFAGLMIAISLPIEKKRMKIMINEFKMIIEEKARNN